VNPIAGKSSIRNELLEIVTIFSRSGYIPNIYVTKKKNHAIELVKEYAKNYNILVCIGGDGTLHEVVSGILLNKIDIKVGYIPMGTTNDFAASLRIPNNIALGCNAIIKGKEFKCDMGLFEDKYFTYIAAFGAFTEVSYKTSQSQKNLFGRLAYIMEGIKRIPNIAYYDLKIDIDDEQIEGNFVFGAIMNARSIAGIQGYVSRHADLDDGLFEVLLIKTPKNPLDLQEIVASLLKSKMDSRFMIFKKAKHVKVHSLKNIEWTLDGESGGS
ncbi:MAG: diacylglycerol kinase family lipid kinase, partial [Erysipelotrichaceae bacterium]